MTIPSFFLVWTANLTCPVLSVFTLHLIFIIYRASNLSTYQVCAYCVESAWYARVKMSSSGFCKAAGYCVLL